MIKSATTTEITTEFEENGFVILREFLEPGVLQSAQNELETLVEGCAQKLFREGKISSSFDDEPFATRLYRLYENHLAAAPRLFRKELHLPGMFDLFFHARLLDVVETILGPELRLYPNYSVRPKLPEWEGHQVLWHQDGGYTESGSDGDVNSLRMINVWASLVPANVENGCMQFVPGTHTLGTVSHEKKTHYLEIAAEHLAPRLDEAVNIEMNPGDVVIFHNLLFHQGLPNRSKAVRWSADWRYQDATQSTLRRQNGHLARSRTQPESAVQNAKQWAELSFS